MSDIDQLVRSDPDFFMEKTTSTHGILKEMIFPHLLRNINDHMPSNPGTGS